MLLAQGPLSLAFTFPLWYVVCPMTVRITSSRIIGICIRNATAVLEQSCFRLVRPGMDRERFPLFSAKVVVVASPVGLVS